MVSVEGARLEQVSEFKYSGYVLDELGTGVAEWEERGNNCRGLQPEGAV